MRNRLGSGKPCANGGTELTLIGYFIMSEGLALRFGSDVDVSGNADIATLGAASAPAKSIVMGSSNTMRTIVSNATGISTAVCICTGYYCIISSNAVGSPVYTYAGYGACVIMAGSTGSCSIAYYDSYNSSPATGSITFTVTSTSVTQTYNTYSNANGFYGFSPCTVIYF